MRLRTPTYYGRLSRFHPIPAKLCTAYRAATGGRTQLSDLDGRFGVPADVLGVVEVESVPEQLTQ